MCTHARSTMIVVIALSLLFLGELCQATTGQGVIYCVRQNYSANCSAEDHCDQCQILQYYLKNADTMIDKENKVTMIFMDGSHTSTVTAALSVPSLIMKGKQQSNVSVQIISLKGNLISMENLNWLNTSLGVTDTRNASLKDCTLQDSTFVASDVTNMSLVNCELLGPMAVLATSKTKITLQRCTLVNYDPHTAYNLKVKYNTEMILEDCSAYGSGIRVDNSTAVIKGNTSISACNIIPAITAINAVVTLSGRVTLANNSDGAMFLYLSQLIIASGANIDFTNNSVTDNGGALYLYSSTFHIQRDINVTFYSNSAFNRGGAIFIEPGIPSNQIDLHNIVPYNNCFFYSNDYYLHANILFVSNSARNGDNIYGASLNDCCETRSIHVNIVNSSMSSISSVHLRVCLCDTHGVPHCDVTQVHQRVHPGESFTAPVVLVGWDLESATTTGVVYADLLSTGDSTSPQLDSTSRDGHVISDSKQCTNLSFALFSKQTPQNATMYISAMHMNAQVLDSPHRLSSWYHFSPISVSITVLPCPPGFTLKDKRCVCYFEQVLFDNCSIVNGRGYFAWNKTAWVSIKDEGIQYNTHCPFDYCNITGEDNINLQDDSDSQCAFNRAGRLCGGCKDNYSLAIGSSHCIHCPNNNNLALLIFFAAAGFLLVFFISAFNLTVTQGMINGLIFYTNIVWTYQSIFFPQELVSNPALTFLKTFIAWVNLDFGIETCFVSGLDAFWKTWLQFIFPFYIWIIAGLIILAAKYSTRLTNLLGNRGVPVLNTLFLLSYTKLLRTVVSIMQVSILYEYPNNSNLYVWSYDGNFRYCKFPHLLLFLAGLTTLILGLLLTLVLFSMQWLRKGSHVCLLKCLTNRLHPVYDACFAPLKHKHQYWFGALLLARVILLGTFSASFSIPQNTNLLVLLIFVTILSFYMAHSHPYKSKVISLVNNSFLLNLTILSGCTIFAYEHPNMASLQAVTIGLSMAVVFLQFCGIVLHSVLGSWCSKSKCCICKKRAATEPGDIAPPQSHVHEVGFRDSILNDSDTEPLLPTY